MSSIDNLTKQLNALQRQLDDHDRSIEQLYSARRQLDNREAAAVARLEKAHHTALGRGEFDTARRIEADIDAERKKNTRNRADLDRALNKIGKASGAAVQESDRVAERLRREQQAHQQRTR